MKPICFLAGCLFAYGALAAEPDIGADAAPAATAARDATDSARLEHELQRLPWPQFRSVVESIPKLKSDVDAFGPLGWQYVRANYATYGWKRNIDRLDDEQKRRLADLIEDAKARAGADDTPALKQVPR